jgi:uncharacterized protein Yka (UPF0111/DUF47 family)
MKALKQLFGRDDHIFNLLEASAGEAQGSVRMLKEIVTSADGPGSMSALILSRRKDKRITEEITEHLCRTFVTPLEREDIESLAVALYKIPKTVLKFSEKFIVCHQHLSGVDFSPQLRLLEQATDTLILMVRMLKEHAGLDAMKARNEIMHQLESEADRLMLDLLKDLYSGSHDPLRVIVLRDLYETLELIIDRCRDAGNVIFQVVLKYS